MTRSFLLRCLLVVALAACTRTLDFSEECTRDEACASLGAGLVCASGRCVGGANTSDASPRDAGISGRSDAELPGVPGLLAEGCAVLGPPGAEAQPQRHHLLAAWVPTHAEEAEAARGALALAVEEINDSGGLNGRSFAVITCPEPEDGAVLERRTRQMAEAVTVPALIGASTPERTARVYTAAGPLGLLVLQPGGPEPLRAAVGDQGRLWHLVEGAPASARAAAALVEHLGGDVLIVHRDDAWGTALATALEEAACAAPCRLPFTPFTPLGEVALAAAARDPDQLVTVARPSDFHFLYATLADYSLTATVAVEGPREVEVLTEFLALDAEGVSALPPWRRAARVALLCESGTLNASIRGPAYAAWAARFDAAWPEVTRWPSTPLYADAVFVLAYALAAIGNGEATGDQLAGGFGRLGAGERVSIGGADWTRGLGLIAEGIDLEGASGGLRFDTDRGIARSGVGLSWYDGEPALREGGLVLDDDGRFTAPEPRARCGEE